MGDVSKISWTKSTFNAWIGCQRVDELCRSCYAEERSNRYQERGPRGLPLWGPEATSDRRVTSASNWHKPRRWNEEAKASGELWPVFCSSLSDVFEDRPELVESRARLFRLIEETPALTWQLLTKRPENILRLCPETWARDDLGFPKHVWVGTSVGDQKSADTRTTILSQVPCHTRFLSIEPMIEVIDRLDLAGISWGIVGGESGPRARPFDLRQARNIVSLCHENGVAVFVKQLGERWSRDNNANDRHGADPIEWPADLRIQEFPHGLKMAEALHAD